jgi:hypothetical protein
MKTSSNIITIIFTVAAFAATIISCGDNSGETGEKIIVYITGTDGSTPVLWKNGKPQSLTDSTRNAQAYSIVVSVK